MAMQLGLPLFSHVDFLQSTYIQYAWNNSFWAVPDLLRTEVTGKQIWGDG